MCYSDVELWKPTDGANDVHALYNLAENNLEDTTSIFPLNTK